MRNYLRRIADIWKARLSRKITVTVFLGIIAIETVILVPSVYRREQELLNALEALASAKVMGVSLAQPDPGRQSRAARAAAPQSAANARLQHPRRRSVQRRRRVDR